MKNPILWIAASALLVGVGVGVSCSSGSTCSIASCAGCCDSTGHCQAGSSGNACGAGGATCQQCPSGQVCQANACTATNGGGGDGGGNGQDAGNGSGTDGGGNGTDGGNGSGTDAGGNGTDAGRPADAGMFACGSLPHCATGSTCCVSTAGGTTSTSCVASCPNPADVVSCGSPADCTSGDVCCGNIVLDGGMFPSCTLTAFGASCQPTAQCPTNIAFTCQATDTINLCNTGADCTDPNNNNCCDATAEGATARFCMNAIFVTLLDAGNCN